jgi:hypothetical protein
MQKDLLDQLLPDFQSQFDNLKNGNLDVKDKKEQQKKLDSVVDTIDELRR